MRTIFVEIWYQIQIMFKNIFHGCRFETELTNCFVDKIEFNELYVNYRARNGCLQTLRIHNSSILDLFSIYINKIYTY